jgi:hypothetical protein
MLTFGVHHESQPTQSFHTRCHVPLELDTELGIECLLRVEVNGQHAKVLVARAFHENMLQLRGFVELIHQRRVHDGARQAHLQLLVLGQRCHERVAPCIDAFQVVPEADVLRHAFDLLLLPLHQLDRASICLVDVVRRGDTLLRTLFHGDSRAAGQTQTLLRGGLLCESRTAEGTVWRPP